MNQIFIKPVRKKTAYPTINIPQLVKGLSLKPRLFNKDLLTHSLSVSLTDNLMQMRPNFGPHPRLFPSVNANAWKPSSKDILTV